MTIIVTGGAGFIGSNFVFHMLNKYPDYRIICLDKLTYAGNLSTLAPVMDNPNFRFVKADICDRDAVYQLFEEEHPDMVVNFAAESHVDRSMPSIRPRFIMNLAGCRRQSLRMVSRRRFSGIWITVSGGRLSSVVSIRIIMRRCMAIDRIAVVWKAVLRKSVFFYRPSNYKRRIE